MVRRFINTACILVIGGWISACDGSPTRPSTTPATPTTFRLTGAVSEEGDFRVIGAKVTVMAGTPDEQSAFTGDRGRYVFQGLKGVQTVAVTADGYATVTKQVTVDSDTTLDIQIAPAVPPADISGAWRATLDASKCPTPSPVDRTRTYQAVIAQQGAHFTVDFSAATFVGRTQFAGLVRGNHVTFSLGDWDNPGLMEQLGENQFLSIWGDVAATADASSIKGTLDVVVSIGETPTGPFQDVTCGPADYRITFQR
jgi:hypothetical protein